MSWIIEEALAQFGQQSGLPALNLGANGVAHIELQTGGFLAVEPAGGHASDVLVYLARPLGYNASAVLRKALARAHHSGGDPMPVQVAVRGRDSEALLLAMVRIAEREFTGQSLAGAVEFLGRWIDGARHG